MQKIQNFRRQRSELFQTGEYLPLYGEGKFRGHVCAFARRLDNRLIVSAALATWRNKLTGESLRALPTQAGRSALLLREIFASFPVALLGIEPEAEG